MPLSEYKGYLITTEKFDNLYRNARDKSYRIWFLLPQAILNYAFIYTPKAYVWEVSVLSSDLIERTTEWMDASTFALADITADVYKKIDYNRVADTVRHNTGRHSMDGAKSHHNSGNFNHGMYNSGNNNEGNENSGSHNYMGSEKNTGNYNIASYNTGDYNDGELCTGNSNQNAVECTGTGNRQASLCSGHYNNASAQNGVFCTHAPKALYVYDKPHDPYKVINLIQIMTISTTCAFLWVPQERIKVSTVPEHVWVIEGYLKNALLFEVFSKWWAYCLLKEQAFCDAFITHPLCDVDEIERVTGLNIKDPIEYDQDELINLYESPLVNADNSMGTGNTMSNNVGDYNTGNRNYGSFNTGNGNVGNSNTGDYNKGNFNSGHLNIGSYNSGKYNFGNHNVGNFNKADRCVGIYNTANNCIGAFNEKEQEALFFNKPSGMTLSDWEKTRAYDILVGFNTHHNNQHPDERIVPRYFDLDKNTSILTAMSRQNRSSTPIAFAEPRDDKNFFAPFWKSLTKEEQDIVTAMPNFDKEIFKQITGVAI